MDEAILGETLSPKAWEMTWHRTEAQGTKPEFTKLITSKKHKLLSTYFQQQLLFNL